LTVLDEELVQRVDQLGSSSWSGSTYRYTAERRDPMSGAGARLFGGRWNPKDIFATIYLATPLLACLGEVRRTAATQNTPVEEMLSVPYLLHTINVDGVKVLDLRTERALAHVGLNLSDITDDDWTACQAVGHAAWFLGLSGVLAPSATRAGFVLAAFENRVGGNLKLDASQPLTIELLSAQE
jgi:RES domain-containing protein